MGFVLDFGQIGFLDQDDEVGGEVEFLFCKGLSRLFARVFDELGPHAAGRLGVDGPGFGGQGLQIHFDRNLFRTVDALDRPLESKEVSKEGMDFGVLRREVPGDDLHPVAFFDLCHSPHFTAPGEGGQERRVVTADAKPLIWP